MRAWANLYPWDVDGDPAAADRIAGLGLTGVTLAAAYHAVRAVTPVRPRAAIRSAAGSPFTSHGYRFAQARTLGSEPQGILASRSDRVNSPPR